jgi:hypothetical protein
MPGYGGEYEQMLSCELSFAPFELKRPEITFAVDVFYVPVLARNDT